MTKSSFSNLVTNERKSSEYGTPLDFFKRLDSIFKFELDPCANIDRQLPGISRNITKTDDGLRDFFEWNDNTFINPPFGTKKGEDITAWIKKMQDSSYNYPKYHYVMLLPARIESNWFQDYIFSDNTSLLYAIRGRLTFYNAEKNANNNPHPIGSILYIKGFDIMTDMCVDLRKKIPGRFIQVNYSF